jgi:hypothetical protein
MIMDMEFVRDDHNQIYKVEEVMFEGKVVSVRNVHTGEPSTFAVDTVEVLDGEALHYWQSQFPLMEGGDPTRFKSRVVVESPDGWSDEEIIASVGAQFSAQTFVNEISVAALGSRLTITTIYQADDLDQAREIADQVFSGFTVVHRADMQRTNKRGMFEVAR